MGGQPELASSSIQGMLTRAYLFWIARRVVLTCCTGNNTIRVLLPTAVSGLPESRAVEINSNRIRLDLVELSAR